MREPLLTKTMQIFGDIERTRAAVLGRVNTPDAQIAIKPGIKEFGITNPNSRDALRRG
jgi:hypothetical protein